MSSLPDQSFLGMPAVIASESMRRTMELAARVARTSNAVLINGETGSGKEIVARAIHHYSLRSARPWVDVSCAALPEHLVESELFGYERGAFSGADRPKPGLFEMAHTGTLFLDEIGELEPRMQVKLLRVLDGTPYYRLGGMRKISVDVRILCATNQDLESAIQTGRFRSDLYYRLAQTVVRVPPLRERPEDVLALADFFLSQISEKARLSPDARAALLRHRWSGNVRELRNTIAKSVITAREYEIQAADLPPEVLAAAYLPGFGTGAPLPVPAAVPPAATALDGLERQAILAALAQTNGHHQKAAERLGISRRTLSRKLKLYRAGDGAENCLAGGGSHESLTV